MSLYGELVTLGVSADRAAQAAKLHTQIEPALEWVFSQPGPGTDPAAVGARSPTAEAIQLSLDSLEQSESLSIEQVAQRKQRAPVRFRSSSAHLSSVCAYFEALFAVSSWREALIKSADADNKVLAAIGELFCRGVFTVRAALSIDAVASALELEPSAFQQSSHTPHKISQLHDHLVHLLAAEAGPGPGADSIERAFSLVGVEVGRNAAQAGTLDESSSSSKVNMFTVTLDHTEHSTEAVSLYAALDRALVHDDTLDLISSFPRSVSVKIDRSSNFGSTAAVRLEHTLYLDRYSLARSQQIISARNEQDSLDSDINTLAAAQGELANSTAKHSTLDLARFAAEHVTDSSLSEQLSAISARLGERVEANEGLLSELRSARSAVFAGSDYTEHGYSLSAIVSRNGLNGRSSAWAVVKAEDGRWYSTANECTVEVELESELNSKAGLMLAAGHTFAFYDKQTTEHQPTSYAVPPNLFAEIEADNEQLAANQLALRGGASRDNQHEHEYDDDDDDDDDAGSSNAGEDEDEVELGVLVPFGEGRSFDVDYGVGKVGGAPVWLDPTSPLTFQAVSCPVCSALMSFLCQLNSPDDSQPHASARSLYVFTCTTVSCNSLTRLWRFQMRSPNSFFPHTPDAQARRREAEAKLCPQTALGGTRPSSVEGATAFAEFSIECEPEPYESSYLPEIAMNEIEDRDLDDSRAKDSQVQVDRAFLEFQARIDRVPEQVLRFYRLPSVLSPQPLQVTSSPLPPSEPCGRCGTQREIEFQLIPTLLSFIGDEHISFDSLLFYTCSSNCELREGEWQEEIVTTQHFSRDGVSFGQQPK